MSGRVLAVWCPDWPAVAAAAAAGVPAHQPVAVLLANRVQVCSAPARVEGVRRGLRRREAQSRCPGLTVLPADADRDGRYFEPVAGAVDTMVPGAEVLRPGLLVVPARGVGRFFGGEDKAAERLVDAVGAVALPGQGGQVGVECQVGAADQLFTAVTAARSSTHVAVGGDAAFLAPLPVAVLAAEPELAAPGRADFVDLLRRLGLRTVGDFAALPAKDVASRFDRDAVLAHRRARGEADRPPSARPLPPDVAVGQRFDPPLARVDAAAFAGRALAAQLHTRLAAAAVACTRLRVLARTTGGGELARVWRCAQPLTPDATADRVRWQLDGWLTARAAAGGAGEGGAGEGITALTLEPVEVVDAGALQLGLWDGEDQGQERARRALARVQGLLGGDAVRVGVLSGGVGPGERVTLVPFGDEPVPAADPAPPWPGRMPAPSPSTVFAQPPPARLLDRSGAPVAVTGRGHLTGDPEQLAWRAAQARVRGWSGPWLVDPQWWAERWWEGAARLSVRLQVEVEGSVVVLLLWRDQVWQVEGVYE